MKRNVTITWRPLTQWPAGRARTADWSRVAAKFEKGDWKQNRVGDPTSGATYTKTKTPVSRTLVELDRELYMIGAREIVVQIDVASESQFRVDGTGPLASMRVKSPAVVVSFVRNKVPTVFAGDYFKRWEDNLRGIVLGLEGLRRLDRYHIAQAGDQYRGWQALPASTTPAFNVEQAAAFIARHSGNNSAAVSVASHEVVARIAYRRAAAKTHPDAGGSVGDFQLVQECKRVLEAHFGATL